MSHTRLVSSLSSLSSPLFSSAEGTGRSDRNAMYQPSGENSGEESCPEWVRGRSLLSFFLQSHRFELNRFCCQSGADTATTAADPSGAMRASVISDVFMNSSSEIADLF